ncbi:molybdenum cofactor sulfurase [Drosophila grimshawi]|uniref:Molybdenum cofactor sulfurase n=1 Tax=Drosophila grimshawi TaxID=7222 RepID=MOCOS_DROGR|nr:molybdenum cofactor sulfurase [Drosophila grimshawi]B4JXP7.1 RecName: Full=Molybdenum cofactor sulfurase; Short=MCS; Short=MOS; Short=MoCo sulfurase; AltName: Full=Molybdenum cofactor sulfurtransferase; AltName: Full=Protein maroon-like; Short=Ma-l [Drosophila grimshawi]EDV95146.1 GH17731 [Drosophila grimshawi]
MGDYTAEFTPDEQALIDAEFARLSDSTYLDHAGTTLYAHNQVSDAAQQLQRDVICNPHTCRVTGDYVDQVRYKILEFFNTNADEYHVVFTANASAALRLVADHFDFGTNGNFHYCQENHTSVLGMRQLVSANRIYMLTKDQILLNNGTPAGATAAAATAHSDNSLVVFSAQCNFSGYKMPLTVIEKIQQDGLREPGKCIDCKLQSDPGQSNYYVCLDAASYAASSPLDLRRHRPDYVCLSFYKIFGYPTGVGALLVSKRGAELLKKRFYGGGTVNFAYPHTMEHQLRSTFHERFEDGTLPFLSIVELLQGFQTLQRLVPGRSMERISRHVHSLARYCEQQLLQMQYPNGAPLVTLYNHAGYEDRMQQGGIVAFNVRTAAGDYVGFGEIASVAALHRILLRTGCFCNVGACQHFMNLNGDAMDAIYKLAGRICGDYYDLLDGRPTGAVRVSFGYMTRLQDVDRLLQMLRDSYLSVKWHQRLDFIEQRVQQLPKLLQQRAQQLRPQLLQLAIYPVKSCAALKMPASALTDQGLQYDREWMIVDLNGMALTQKRCTDLCLIQPRIVADQLQLHFNGDGSTTFVSVPLSLTDQATNSARCQSKVCRQSVEGYDCGDEVANWLCQQLGLDGLRLLRQSAQRRAPGDRQQLSLVNQAQFLLVNRASVRSLGFEEPLDETVDRFRSNIVIDTGVPFEELEFGQLRIGEVLFQVEGPCQRCDMICINQRTGQRSPDTLTTIARIQSGKMRFGIYISRLPNENRMQPQLACGDPITVLR